MIKFGTGGWRAIIGEDFTFDNIRLVAGAVAQDIISREKTAQPVIIGYDNRFLSDKAAKLCAEVIAAYGIKVLFVEKQAPTPVIMFAVKTFDAVYGMVITASHNPAEYNGIKIIIEEGKDARIDDTNRLEEIITHLSEPKRICFEEGIQIEKIQILNPFNEYIDVILNMIDVEAIRKRGIKAILDTMYGVSKITLQTILMTARCELDIINDRHDTLFGGRLPAPNNHTLAKLQRLVMEKGVDLGIATDGDADRLGIISNKGRFIHPNEIMVMLYYYLLKYKGWKGAVVRNIATTHLVDKIAEDFGEKCYEVPVGFKHISSKMEEVNALIGGESSGGLTIRGHIKGKDGIFAASILVEALSVTGMSIEEFLEEIYISYGTTAFGERNITFPSERKAEMEKRIYIEKTIPEFNYEIEKVSYIDGLKIYFNNGGWVSARFSGTEPLLRIFSEMSSEDKVNQVIDTFAAFLKL